MECESCPLLLEKTQSCPVGGDTALVYLMVCFSVLPYLLILLYFGLFLFKPSSPVRVIMLSGIVTATAALLLKEIIQQGRPFGSCSHSYGMPSNHVALTSCFVTVQVFLYRDSPTRVLGYLALLVSVAFSRVFLNYHTPVQCLAGTVLGFCIAVLCLRRHEKTEKLA